MIKKFFSVVFGAILLVVLGAGCLNNNADNNTISTTTPTTTTSTTVSGTQQNQAESGYLRYANAQEGYSIDYPSDFVYAQNQKNPAGLDSFSGTKFILSNVYFNGTNLSNDSAIYVYKGCARDQYYEKIATGTVQGKLGKFDFYKQQDAGAGNLYTSSLWTTKSGNECYNILFFAHSSNILNYDEANRPKAYDDTKLQSILMKMAQSIEAFNPPIIDKANGVIEVSQYNFKMRYPVKYFSNVTYSDKNNSFSIQLASKVVDTTIEKGKSVPAYLVDIFLENNPEGTSKAYLEKQWTYLMGTTEGKFKKVSFANTDWIETIGIPAYYRTFSLTTATDKTLISVDLGTNDLEEFSSNPTSDASQEAMEVYKQILTSIVKNNP